MELIIATIPGFFIFVYPFIITILNILIICGRKDTLYDKRHKYTKITLIYGFILFYMLVFYLSSYKWDKPIVYGTGEVLCHQPFSEDYLLILIIIEIISVASLLLLDRPRKMPPLAAVLCVCGTYSGLILFTLSGIQFLGILSSDTDKVDNLFLIYLWIYIINYYLCAVRVLREVITDYCSCMRENDMFSRSKLSRNIAKKLCKVSRWFIFPILCLIPLTGLIVCITIICGQGPDAIIKAFTETSEWTFSRMISPPPVQYDGHYLCTVAVNGHEKIVKPTRLGIRHGTKIIVNRQLCTANAFEQLIEDKAPRFHRLVRYIYDRYGYPISKHITTKFRADVIYIIMKPLERLFLVTLYLFDADPESRIALQYTGKHINEFKTL